ncbi:hypothetical protein QYF36_014607 [Acer negundo]|nr:hypothetical protein QYF36_014607 [Acer negundo]
MLISQKDVLSLHQGRAEKEITSLNHLNDFSLVLSQSASLYHEDVVPMPITIIVFWIIDNRSLRLITEASGTSPKSDTDYPDSALRDIESKLKRIEDDPEGSGTSHLFNLMQGVNSRASHAFEPLFERQLDADNTQLPLDSLSVDLAGEEVDALRGRYIRRLTAVLIHHIPAFWKVALNVFSGKFAKVINTFRDLEESNILQSYMNDALKEISKACQAFEAKESAPPIAGHLERIASELVQNKSSKESMQLQNGYSSEPRGELLFDLPGSVVDPHQRLLIVLSNIGYCKDELSYELCNKYKHIWLQSRERDQEDADSQELVMSFTRLEEKVLGQYTFAKALAQQYSSELLQAELERTRINTACFVESIPLDSVPESAKAAYASFRGSVESPSRNYRGTQAMVYPSFSRQRRR